MWFVPKMNSILLPQFTGTLNITFYQMFNVNWSAFLEGIFPIFQITTGTMATMNTQIGWWGAKISPTASVAC